MVSGGNGETRTEQFIYASVFFQVGNILQFEINVLAG
jgi:hypothetical protein